MLGRDSSSVMEALTCGVARMPGANPRKATSMSPKTVGATSEADAKGSGSRFTEAA